MKVYRNDNVAEAGEKGFGWAEYTVTRVVGQTRWSNRFQIASTSEIVMVDIHAYDVVMDFFVP